MISPSWLCSADAMLSMMRCTVSGIERIRAAWVAKFPKAKSWTDIQYSHVGRNASGYDSIFQDCIAVRVENHDSEFLKR